MKFVCIYFVCSFNQEICIEYQPGTVHGGESVALNRMGRTPAYIGLRLREDSIRQVITRCDYFSTLLAMLIM